MNPSFFDILIAAGLFGSLIVTLEAGYRFGLHRRQDGDSQAGAQIGAIQGAVLGLMGLLLAFSFAAAGARFLERQDLIVKEANAIGTAYLRADLLPPGHQRELQSALQRYTEHRIEVSSRLRGEIFRQDADEIQRLQGRIWSVASAGVNAKPEVMLGVLPPINDVFDIHTERVFAGKKHVPALVLGLLIACSLLSVGVIGYGCGISGRRRATLTWSLAIIVASSLWITIDLDHPRAGLLRLSDEPLKMLRFDAPTATARP